MATLPRLKVSTNKDNTTDDSSQIHKVGCEVSANHDVLIDDSLQNSTVGCEDYQHISRYIDGRQFTKNS